MKRARSESKLSNRVSYPVGSPAALGAAGAGAGAGARLHTGQEHMHVRYIAAKVR